MTKRAASRASAALCGGEESIEDRIARSLLEMEEVPAKAEQAKRVSRTKHGAVVASSAGSSASVAEHGQFSAAEHGGKVWEGAIGTARMNLSGQAIDGDEWEKHRKMVLPQLIAMLNHGNVVGLCLSDFGNVDDPLTDHGERRVESLLAQAFGRSNAAAHKQLSVLWP